MGTSIYDFKPPWSSVKLEPTPTHTRLHIWQDGGKAGVLTIDSDAEKVEQALDTFRGKEIAQISAARQGPVIFHIAKSRTRYVMTEYGEIFLLETLFEKYLKDDNIGYNPIPETEADWFV